MGKAGLVGETDQYGTPVRASSWGIHVLQVCLLVGVEIDVDRIERNDRREQSRGRRARLYQIARGNLGAPDASGYRRAHDGPFQVQSRDLGGGLGGANRCIAFCLATGA